MLYITLAFRHSFIISLLTSYQILLRLLFYFLSILFPVTLLVSSLSTEVADRRNWHISDPQPSSAADGRWGE